MKYYPSEAKRKRAESAIGNYASQSPLHPDKAEYRLVALGQAEKLEGEALLDFVYNGLSGSPILEGVAAKEAEGKAKAATVRTRKKSGAATQRSKITVK